MRTSQRSFLLPQLLTPKIAFPIDGPPIVANFVEDFAKRHFDHLTYRVTGSSADAASANVSGGCELEPLALAEEFERVVVTRFS